MFGGDGDDLITIGPGSGDNIVTGFSTDADNLYIAGIDPNDIQIVDLGSQGSPWGPFISQFELTVPGVGTFTITGERTWQDIQPQDIIDRYISDQEFDPPVDPACLTLGTLVTTKKVEQSVEYLRVGDLVLTKDHGYQTIRRIGQRTLLARGRMAPICIGKGVFGNSRDLLVSPCYRMLLSNLVLHAVFGNSEMLIAARDLLGHD